MKKKGFTLVELLAVIIIIGVIALIATPVIINVMDNAEKNTFEQSVNGLIRAVTNDSDSQGYKSVKYKVVEGVLYDEENNKIHTSGGDKENGDIYINDDGDISVAVNNKKWCVIKEYDNNKIKITDYVEGKCKIESTVVELPTYSIEPSGDVWAKSKVVTIHYPERESNYQYEYSIDNGNSWETVTSGTEKKVTFTTNGNVIARIYDGNEYHTASSFAVTKIDNIAPQNVSVSKTGATTKSITVKANGYDYESGIGKYEFSKDNGSSWIDNGTNSTYTFTNLSSGSYQVKVRITDKVGNATTSNTVSMSTTSVPLPTYIIEPSGDVWARSKTVTVHYPERQSGFIYQYSLNGGSSWTTVSSGTTKDVEFTSNGNIIARIYDGTNYYTASSFAITKIDNTPPSCTSSGGNGEWTKNNVTINGICSDNQSGCTENISKTFDQSTNTTTASPGTVYDNVGNSTVCPANQTVKIDKTAPTVPNINNPSNQAWTNKDFSLTVSTSEWGSGVDYWQYSYDQSKWNTYPNSASENFTTSPYSVERDQYTYIRVCDKVGNCSQNQTMIRIDKTPPNISWGVIRYPPDNPQAQLKIYADITDSLSGYNCFSATWSSGSANLCRNGLKYGQESFYIPYYNGYATISVCDMAGNCSSSRKDA